MLLKYIHPRLIKPGIKICGPKNYGYIIDCDGITIVYQCKGYIHTVFLSELISRLLININTKQIIYSMRKII